MKSANDRRRIAVIGCGSLGSLLAGLFALAGYEVWGAARSRDHREAIAANGLILKDGSQETKVNIHACFELPATIESQAAQFDLALITVKSYDTEQAAVGLAKILSPGTPILTLQNGLGNAETLAAQLPSHPIIVGSATFGALREGAGVVRLTGRGECVVGNWEQSDLKGNAKEPEAEINSIAALFESAGIPCRIAADVRTILWKKLAINAVINPLTALLRVRNGELVESINGGMRFRKGVDGIAIKVLSEICAVASKRFIALPPAEELLRETRNVCQGTSENQSSMFRDAERGHRTEIDAINGAVVRIGAEYEIAAASNRRLAAMVNAGQRFATVESLSVALDLS